MQAHSLAIARSADQRAAPSDLAAQSEIKLIGMAKSFSRDQEIFAEGEAADWVYKVVSGSVRQVRGLADGRRQICDFYLPGDIFGIEGGAERQAGAEAVTDAVVIVARRSSLFADPQGAGILWRLAVRDLRRCQDHVLTLGRRTAAERVAQFMLELADRLGAGEMLELPMSRQDIADYLGLTIETVSRTFTQLQSEGLIEVHCCRKVRLARRAALADLCE